MNEIIKAKIGLIDALEDDVRDHINSTRYQNSLISDSGNWNQICCSLDTIGDTLYAINDYVEADYPQQKTGLIHFHIRCVTSVIYTTRCYLPPF
jgi:hypothetical protein